MLNGNTISSTEINAIGFSGDDCSFIAGQAPTLRSTQGSGLCDLRLRACRSSRMYGDGIKRSSFLTCKLRSKSDGTSVTTQAQYISPWEVICELPPTNVHPAPAARTTRAVTSDNGAHHSWDVSLSNDNSQFSESQEIIVYDSKCQTCSKTGCSQKVFKIFMLGHLFWL